MNQHRCRGQQPKALVQADSKRPVACVQGPAQGGARQVGSERDVRGQFRRLGRSEVIDLRRLGETVIGEPTQDGAQAIALAEAVLDPRHSQEACKIVTQLTFHPLREVHAVKLIFTHSGCRTLRFLQKFSLGISAAIALSGHMDL